MNGEDNKMVVQSYVQAICDGDVDALRRIVSDQVNWTIVGVRQVTYEELNGVWTSWFTPPPGPGAMKIVGLTAEGERVAAEVEGKMTLPDGRLYANKYHMLFEIKNARIAAVREYMDTAYAAKIFGEPG